MKGLKEIWDYREMIGRLVRKDLSTRYKGSVLGFLWTFINPLFQLLIYSVVFGFIMKQTAIQNYAMFLFVALVPWIFCSTALTVGAQSILINGGLVQKVYFPRIVLPIVTVTSNFVNMLYSFIVVFAALLITGWGISPVVVMLPVIMVIEYFFVLGLVFIFSALTVYFRDLEHILGIVTMAWMYVTPILYAIKSVPEKFQAFMYINPMTSVILAYRNVLYDKVMPDFSNLMITIAFAVSFVVFGYFLFQKLQRRFAEEL
jgi:ABC-type polysaccharide/polyol phosphate export systems, permease component